MYERGNLEPSAQSRSGPPVTKRDPDIPDGVLAAVRRELGQDITDTQVIHNVAAAVCDALANEIPEHHGPMAQSYYAAWLAKRAWYLRERKAWKPPVTTTSL